MKRTLTPDVSSFPTPQEWATFVPIRSPQFKTHSHLSHVKNALAGQGLKNPPRRMINGSMSSLSGWVFRFDFEAWKWVEYAHITQETTVGHWLWDARPKRQAKDVADADLQSALASIALAAGRQGVTPMTEEQTSSMEKLSLPGYQLPRLRSMAREKGLKGYSKMNRAQLIDALREAM